MYNVLHGVLQVNSVMHTVDLKYPIVYHILCIPSFIVKSLAVLQTRQPSYTLVSTMPQEASLKCFMPVTYSTLGTTYFYNTERTTFRGLKPERLPTSLSSTSSRVAHSCRVFTYSISNGIATNFHSKMETTSVLTSHYSSPAFVTFNWASRK